MTDKLEKLLSSAELQEKFIKLENSIERAPDAKTRAILSKISRTFLIKASDLTESKRSSYIKFGLTFLIYFPIYLASFAVLHLIYLPIYLGIIGLGLSWTPIYNILNIIAMFAGFLYLKPYAERFHEYRDIKTISKLFDTFLETKRVSG